VKTFLGAAVKNGFKSVGVITTDDASGIAINGAISGAAKGLGLLVTSELIANTATDATVQVEALQAANVGMIYDGIIGTGGAVPLRAAKQLGMTTPIVVNAGDVYGTFLAAAKGSILGSIYGAPPSNLAVPALLNHAQYLSFQSFDKRYKKVTGKLMNLATTNFIGVTQASTAAEILLNVGATPSLARAENYLLTQRIPGILGVRFTASPQVVADPVGLAEASSTALVWGACKNSAVLQCPTA
jgi:ABC-type branched-subunit amino acid transport system substrate-binding protein